MADTRPAWQPTFIRRHIDSFPTGAGAVLVQTDSGRGYLKAIGNAGGEHVLACEWVGTQLARWFGLSTFDFCLIDVADDLEIPFAAGGQASHGRAFITRAECGDKWGGKERELKRLINPQDISRLVVFDTWTLNCDRHSVGYDGKLRIKWDNVFLSSEAPKGKLKLKAMDHTHCFTCGRDLTPKIARIDRVQDARIYGLFPEFRRFLDRGAVARSIRRMQALDRDTVEEMIHTIPPAWDVSQAAGHALAELILGRARHVSQTILDALWPQKDLPFE